MNMLREEEAATAVEYALMAGLVAVMIAATVGALGISLQGVFESFTAQAF